MAATACARFDSATPGSVWCSRELQRERALHLQECRWSAVLRSEGPPKNMATCSSPR